ncbi:MAG TPA: alpha/beta hydrolase-fold protein [Jatrophihabitantaceae bacterium]|nr:alpha/beta hydrolase-fold protein [Jatrophihabitantaceae bacterium]
MQLSLTGPGFLSVVILVTVAAFVSTVVLWPRLSVSQPWTIVRRSLMMLGVNALVVLTAAVALNDQYTFFADWADLHGAVFGAQGGSTAFAGGNAAQAANASLPPAAGRGAPAVLPSLPPGATRQDRVLRYTVTGAVSGLRGAVLVSLPIGYSDPSNAERRYPVLETFNGYPGGPSQWIDSMGLGNTVDKAVASHTVSPVVIISPLIEFPGGVDTECVNGIGTNPKVETWVTQDVPDWALRTFRVRSDRSSWATIGLSAGAYCAAMAAMLHPGQYGAAIVLGGYFAPEFSRNYRPFSGRSPQGSRYDLLALTARQPPPVAVWMETSHSDPTSYPSSAKLLAIARPPLSVFALVFTHAGHRFSIWRPLLPQVLAWLGANLHGFSTRPV